MKNIRNLMCWVFAFSALMCLWNTNRVLLYGLAQHGSLRSVGAWVLMALLPVLAAVYAITSWAVLTKKRSGKGWGIASSLTFVVFSLFGIFRPPQILPEFVWVGLAIGIIGLIVFSEREVDKTSIDIFRRR